MNFLSGWLRRAQDYREVRAIEFILLAVTVLAIPPVHEPLGRFASATSAWGSCRPFEYRWKILTSEDAPQIYREFHDALAMAGEKQANWKGARRELSRLENENWALPGIRENLAAVYLEMEGREAESGETNGRAEAAQRLDAEDKLLRCIDSTRSESEIRTMSLVDPAVSPSPSTAEIHNVLMRARAISNYYRADLRALEGDAPGAFHALEYAFSNGYPATSAELDDIERDRFLTPLRKLQQYDSLLAPLRRQFGKF